MGKSFQMIGFGVLDDWGGLRIVVGLHINRGKLAFYRSASGTSGKVQGNWYPVFGYGIRDSWFVKGGRKMERGYDNPYILEAMQWLNANYRSDNDDDIINKLKAESVREFPNVQSLFIRMYGLSSHPYGVGSGRTRLDPKTDDGKWTDEQIKMNTLINTHIKMLIDRTNEEHTPLNSPEEDKKLISFCNGKIKHINDMIDSIGFTKNRSDFKSEFKQLGIHYNSHYNFFNMHKGVFSSDYLVRDYISDDFVPIYKDIRILINKMCYTIIKLSSRRHRDAKSELGRMSPKDRAEYLMGQFLSGISDYIINYLYNTPNPEIAYAAKKILDGSVGLDYLANKLMILNSQFVNESVAPGDIADLLSEDIRVNNGFRYLM